MSESAGFDLPSIADTATRTAIAALTLVAVLLVVLALARSWSARRRPQVVLEDTRPVDGIDGSATIGVSQQLRQTVGQVLGREGRDASHAVLETIDQDVRSGLLRMHGLMRVHTITAGLRSTTDDSLTSLAAGIRGIAPKEAEGLLAAVGAALPAQRGWIVRAFPVLRGAGSEAEVGITLEFGGLGRPADSVTTFWTSIDSSTGATTGAAEATEIRALLHRLVVPAARWVATRLVARQLAASDVPARRRLLSGNRQRQQLAGLQRQLAGQLSLYAMQEQEAFERGFAGQALADLADAKELLPGYFRPHLAEGNVRERLGWSYRRSGDRDNAEQEFSRAVLDYTDAFQALSGAKGADATERAAAVERVRVRQTKCRLLTGDPADAILAKEELARLDCMQASTPLALYNAACLFCIAMSSPGLPVGDRGRYAQRAWVLLGLALLAGGRDGPWERSTTDVELEAMTRERLIAFEAELKVRHPTLVPLRGDQALRIVQESLPVVLADGPAPPHP